MGRVSLIVSADTSDAITKITGLGQAIQTAMSKFDSKSIATWEKNVETEINKTRSVLQKLKEEFNGLGELLKSKPNFGALDSLNKFKDSLSTARESLSTFKASFKENYTFGATAQIETFKAKVNEAKQAIAALNAEASKSTGLGANQTARARKDEITKTIAAVEQLNRKLAARPTIGATEAVRNLEVSLQRLSGNIPNYISPISSSINALKTQMLELSQVLNSVQQPTWIEPFRRQMRGIISELNQVRNAYNRVRTEIGQPIGESAARREFQMTDRQAQSLYRTTRMFYRHIRREFQETRQAATETSRAIREAMAAVQGGGGGGGGGGAGGAHGARLGFGEQLWSRMRSNLYSYLTMWFGVAGAIRLANGLLEQHNQYLEQGKRFNQTEYEALGELNLKAGEKAPEYEAAAKKLARGGFGSTRDAYQFASAAAMSGISVKDMEEIAPIFRSNLAAGGDQKALMAAISYIKSTYGDQYSTKEIAAMILEANSNNPSNIAPTANAIQNLLESYGGMGIPLPDLIAMFTVGSEKNKDARIGTMLRAFGTAMRTKGLEAMAIGDVMSERGIAGYDYYKDERTGAYKFKDEELQRQLESGDLAVTMDVLANWSKGKGREIVKDIGANLRTWGGAQLLADIAAKPEEFNRILGELEDILKNGTKKLDETLNKTSLNIGVAVTSTEKGVAAVEEQTAAPEAAMNTSWASVQKVYDTKYPSASGWRIGRKLQKMGEWLFSSKGNGSEGSYDFLTPSDKLDNATRYLKAIENDENISEDQKELAREAYINMIRSMIEMYAKEQNLNFETPEQVANVAWIFHGKYKGWNTLWGDWGSYSTFEKYFPEAQRRSEALAAPPARRKPTAAAGAVKAAAAGVKYVNQDEEEKEKAKAEKAEAKAAKAEAKAEETERKRKEKEEWDSVMGLAVKPQRNLFLQDVFDIANSDMDTDLQAVKGAALNDKWSKGKTEGILGQAFYAYASEKTDEATDKKIVEQLVATLNQGGVSLDDMGQLVVKYANSVEKDTGSVKEKEILLTFMNEVTNYLKNISDGTEQIAHPINQPKR